MNYETKDETKQRQDEQQARFDEYRRLIRKYLPFEVCLREVQELAVSNNKRIRRQALKLVKKMERSQELATDESAGAKTKSDAHPDKPSRLSGRVTVERGAW